jgi:hypothetical protein
MTFGVREPENDIGRPAPWWEDSGMGPAELETTVSYLIAPA